MQLSLPSQWKQVKLHFPPYFINTFKCRNKGLLVSGRTFNIMKYLQFSSWTQKQSERDRDNVCLVFCACVQANERDEDRPSKNITSRRTFLFWFCNYFLASLWATLQKASLNNTYTAYILLFRAISHRGQNVSNQNRKRHRAEYKTKHKFQFLKQL